MMERNSVWSFFFVLCSVVLFSNILLGLAGGEQFRPPVNEQHLVPRECRRTIASSEFGTITAVDVNDKEKGTYHLQFITLDTGSLFLPVLLHADMVFYVHTGSGTVTWVSEDKSNSIEVERGDIYRIEEGNVFYVQSHSNATREKLRIHAIFNTITDESHLEEFVGPYSNISDLVRGFSDKVLQMGFGVSEDVTKGIKWVERPPPIVQFQPKNETGEESNWKEGIFEALVGRKYSISLNKENKKKKKKTKTFNLYKRKPDVENCNGWSIAVSSRDFKPLMDSDIGVFIVNLTRGAMMGPHWNPRATEFAIVIHGEGIVQFVCPSTSSGGKMSSEQFKCQNETFKVKKGDLFVVPRFHPMAQIAFNNDSFVFMGFTTSVSRNHPQYLAGKMSVLRVIDREVLARSFNTANTSTLDRFLDSQEESIILDCTSCAEELERKIEEEVKRREEEEAKKREEEEARRRQEEEEEARREEEDRKKQEEEEARRKEEEEARRKQEEEEEARRREEEEEEARRRQEEEEAEEARKSEEEAARKRKEEEEKEERARRREEEEEEEEEREREEEEAEVRQREEARRMEAETAAARMEQQGKVTKGEEAAAAAASEEEQQAKGNWEEELGSMAEK